MSQMPKEIEEEDDKLTTSRQNKHKVTISLDQDVLDSFKKLSVKKRLGYQTLINQALREHLHI